MDNINFKLKDLGDIFEEYADDIDTNCDYADTEDQEGTVLSVSNYRVVVPKINKSYRFGEWYSYCGGPCLVKNPDYYEFQSEVVVDYDADDKDINNYYSCSTGYLQQEISCTAKSLGISHDELDELDCYIVFDKFDYVTDRYVAVPESVIDKFPDIFSKLSDYDMYTRTKICGQDNKYYFWIVTNNYDFDHASYDFLLDFNNSKFEILVDHIEYLVDCSYEGIITKLDKYLNNEIQLSEVPEFIFEVEFSDKQYSYSAGGAHSYSSGGGSPIFDNSVFGETLLQLFTSKYKDYNLGFGEPPASSYERLVEDSCVRDEVEKLIKKHAEKGPGRYNMKISAVEKGKGYISIREIKSSHFLLTYCFKDIESESEFDYDFEANKNAVANVAVKIQEYFDSFMSNK